MHRATFTLVLLLLVFRGTSQLSISPQVGITRSVFDVTYFRDWMIEPVQSKTQMTFGLSLNYLFDRVELSGDINLLSKTEFNLRTNNLYEDFPPIYAIPSIIENSFLASYRLINTVSVGAGIKLWHFHSFETALSSEPSFSSYNVTNALLNASYIIGRLRLSLAWSKYLTSNSDYQLIKPPQIVSFKIGFDIPLTKKKS